MLRRSSAYLMVPYLHAMSPGVRPSEKGNLYRNNNQNAHARVASIQRGQRLFVEDLMFKMLLFPDQAFFTIATMLLAGFTYYACFRTPKDGVSAHSRQVLGGYSDDQLFQRNSEMGQIFEYHKDTIKNSLGEVEQPAIFEAPVGYTSRSGIFTPKKE